MRVEQLLAEWAAEAPARYSEAAQVAVTDAFVDTIACIIAGSVEEVTWSIRAVAGRSGAGVALATGSELLLPAASAALVGGTAAHALDFDDNFAPASTHASAVLVPSLFALADEEQVSGEALLDAYIVGLELQARIGRLVNPIHYEKGWHATSTLGAIGAAGGCARLLGLDAKRTLDAMSIAFSMASGSRKQFGSMMKPVHAGLAAQNAVLAARMAEAGLAGHAEWLTGQWGFAGLYGEGREAPPLRYLSNDLGRGLAIEVEGLLPKRFPCCGAAHRTLDGILELRNTHGLSIQSIDHVDIFVPAFARENLRFDDPASADEARFSLTYCVSRVLQAGCLTLDDMTSPRVLDASIRPLFHRLIIHTKRGSILDELPEFATPNITRVVRTDGSVYEIGVSLPKGSNSVPFTEQDKLAKFQDCCRWSGRQEHADGLLRLARSIGGVRNFREFSRDFLQVLRGV